MKCQPERNITIFQQSLANVPSCDGFFNFTQLDKCTYYRMPVKETVKRVSGPNRKNVAGGWRQLRNVELHNL